MSSLKSTTVSGQLTIQGSGDSLFLMGAKVRIKANDTAGRTGGPLVIIQCFIGGEWINQDSFGDT